MFYCCIKFISTVEVQHLIWQMKTHVLVFFLFFLFQQYDAHPERQLQAAWLSWSVMMFFRGVWSLVGLAKFGRQLN